jgi:archaellum component FlaF (FlaF/FlaG flagellin family)
MTSIRFDTKNFNKVLNNSVQYSLGFLNGIEISRLEFNRILGGYTAEALGEYIDSKARVNPESLHHVYEWDSVGNRSYRLFKIKVVATNTNISFSTSFTESKSKRDGSSKPFYQKAEIMESGISVLIEPNNSDYLVFEEDGQTIFTRNSITISNPGGSQVAGSFAKVVDEFFNYYFTNSILYSIMKDLSYPEEFSRFFPNAKNGGRQAGVSAGRKYYKVKVGL